MYNKGEYCLTDSGERFKSYLLDMKNGEQYRIAAFEENIEVLGKQLNLSREEMISAYLEVMERMGL